MAERAEELGVDVYSGFPAASFALDGERVIGVQTRDSGIAKDGSRKPTFEAGMDVRAAVTVFGEGPRGHLTKALVRELRLDEGKNPQVYGTGIKEIWAIPEARAKELLTRPRPPLR